MAKNRTRSSDDLDPSLVALGQRLRGMRARRGISRKALSSLTKVSERHLASLELGHANPSVLVIRNIADALGFQISEFLDDGWNASPGWLLIRELLRGRSQDELNLARQNLVKLFDGVTTTVNRSDTIALTGLRGAGKSTLGSILAKGLERRFVELNTEIERIAGCRPEQVHSLYGPMAYRRYERRALDEVLTQPGKKIIATPGGIVSETSTFNVLLSSCYTIWIRATPEEHMGRVIEQGDMRPMAGNREAMEDLKLILSERSPFYAKADLSFDTSGKSVKDAANELMAIVSRLND